MTIDRYYLMVITVLCFSSNLHSMEQKEEITSKRKRRYSKEELLAIRANMLQSPIMSANTNNTHDSELFSPKFSPHTSKNYSPVLSPLTLARSTSSESSNTRTFSSNELPTLTLQSPLAGSRPSPKLSPESIATLRNLLKNASLHNQAIDAKSSPQNSAMNKQ